MCDAVIGDISLSSAIVVEPGLVCTKAQSHKDERSCVYSDEVSRFTD